jgi:hypothetical protein
MAVGPGLPYPDADELANHWWWRPGWQVGTRFYTWHVTVADLLAQFEHVVAYQEPLRRFAFLDLIPSEWLHITVQGIDHTEAIDRAERDAIVDAVAERLVPILAPQLRRAGDPAHGRRVAGGDVEGLAELLSLAGERGAATRTAVEGLRGVRVLLGRDRLAAWHLPAGRGAEVGPMTRQTALAAATMTTRTMTAEQANIVRQRKAFRLVRAETPSLLQVTKWRRDFS